MSCSQSETVTIIYYCDSSLELKHQICTFEKSDNGRVVIPEAFRKNKSIVAVCRGEVEILNKVGERILPSENVA